MYAALRRLRQKLLRRGKQQQNAYHQQHSSSVGSRRPLGLFARLRAAVSTSKADSAAYAADIVSTAGSEEPLNGFSTLPAHLHMGQSTEVHPSRSRLGASSTPYSPLAHEEEPHTGARKR